MPKQSTSSSSASTRWPELFQDFIVTVVPSSVPHAKPLAKSNLTAAQVISRIIRHEDAPPYLGQVAKLQKFSLDKLIQQQVATPTFKPIVHAKVLVHSYLLRRDINIASQYRHGWKTIGGNRLDQVRDSHRNLYPNWRLPDVFEREGTRVNKVPEYLDSRSQGSVPGSETSSVIAQVGMALSRREVSRDVTKEVKSEDDGSIAANECAYHSDDEDGGATLIWQ
ncbi:hypothetical protein VDGL01_04622 [Verticillium dahliae]